MRHCFRPCARRAHAWSARRPRRPSSTRTKRCASGSSAVSGVLLIKIRELGIELGVPPLERAWLFEEHLSHDGEKLRRVRGAVRIDVGRAPGMKTLRELGIFIT